MYVCVCVCVCAQRPNDTHLRGFGTIGKQTAFADIDNGHQKYAQVVMDDLRCYGITLNELNVALAVAFLVDVQTQAQLLIVLSPFNHKGLYQD